MSDRVAELAEKFVVNGLVPLGLVGLLIYFVFQDRLTDRQATYGLIDQLIKQQGDLIQQLDDRDERIMAAVVKALDALDTRLNNLQQTAADIRSQQKVFADALLRQPAPTPSTSPDVAPAKRRR